MFRPSRNRFAARLLAFGLSLYLLAPAPQVVWARRSTATLPAAARADELRLDQPVTKNLSGREVHDYVIAARAGQYLRVELEPEGIELLATLTDPAGQKLLEVECRPDDNCLEPLAIVTDSQGKYHLAVRAKNPVAGAGRYTLRLETLRVAAPYDAERITAERALARGRRLQFRVSTPVALRAALLEYKTAYEACQAACPLLDTASALDSVAGVQALLGDVQAAADSYERELALLRSPAPTPQQQEEQQARAAIVEENVGYDLYYKALADKVRALEHLGRALEFYDAASARLSAVESESARTARDSAARARMRIGQVYNELGAGNDDRLKAVEYFNTSLAAQRELGNLYAEGDVLAHLMSTLQNLNQPGAAIFHGKQAINIYQSLRTHIKDAKLEADTQQDFRDSKAPAYRQLAELLIKQGRLLESEQVLRMLKEQELFELLRVGGDDNAGSSAPAALKPEEAELQRRYQEIADQITTYARQRRALLNKPSLTPAEDDLIKKLESDLTIARGRFQLFLKQLSAELTRTAQTEKVNQIRDSQALSEALNDMGDGTVALYTLVMPHKLYVILFTADDVQKEVEYPIEELELRRKVRDFRMKLQDPTSNPRPLAEELYKIIVGPIANDLENAQAQTLMWSLDGVLRYVPIAALHDGQHYLVERYRTSIFTQASVSRLNAQPVTQWQGVGFGVSKSYPGLRSLPAVRQELRAIFHDDTATQEAAGGVLPGHVLLDEDFTLGSLSAALRKRPPLVHLASHFVFSYGDATTSYLLLGDGSHLSLYDIDISGALYFHGVDLLTLSACETALGDNGTDGMEIDGLAAVAQRKGAEAVVGSLWNVADDSTCLLMQKFYEMLETQKGTSKAEAMRQAQLALLHGASEGPCDSLKVLRNRGLALETGAAAAQAGPVTHGLATSAHTDTPQSAEAAPAGLFTHPFYWAPFTLTGNWR